MVTCFAYSTISKAVCARQRLHTISCGYAMCLLHFPVFSHLRVQSLALATTFCHSFATCVAIAFARSATLPFRCHQCCRGFLLATEILPLNLQPMFLPPPRICPHFLPPMLPLPFCPLRFFPSMLPCRLPPPLPLPVFLPSRLPWLLPSNLGA